MIVFLLSVLPSLLSRVYIWVRMCHAKTKRLFNVDVLPKRRQTTFGCATNVRWTAECYPSTVGTSKGIHIQYVYVRSFDPLVNSEQCTNVPYILPRLLPHVSFVFAFRCKPGLRRYNVNGCVHPPFCSLFYKNYLFTYTKFSLLCVFGTFWIQYW